MPRPPPGSGTSTRTRWPEKELDRIAHIALPLGENTLMGTDMLESWGSLTFGTNTFIALELDTASEAEKVFRSLSDGGTVQMELQKTEGSEKYGTCTDRFGVQWMVSYTGSVKFPK